MWSPSSVHPWPMEQTWKPVPLRPPPPGRAALQACRGAGLSKAPAQRHPEEGGKDPEPGPHGAAMPLPDFLPTPDGRALCCPFWGPGTQLSGRSLLNSSGPQGVVPASCSSRTAVGRQRREGRAPLSAGGCSPCFAPSLPRGPGRTTLPSQLPPAPPAPGLDSPDLQNSLWPRGQAHFFLQNSAITLQMLPEKQVLTPDGVVGR